MTKTSIHPEFAKRKRNLSGIDEIGKRTTISYKEIFVALGVHFNGESTI